MKSVLSFALMLIALVARPQSWQWAKHIGGPGLDGAVIAAVDGNGQMYVTGGYAGQVPPWTLTGCYFDEDTLTGTENSFIAKYSETGGLVWLRQISNAGWVDVGQLVLDTANAVFYTWGTFEGSCNLGACTVTAPGGRGVVLAKWDLDGNCLWARTIASSWLVNGIYGVAGQAMVVDDAGELLVSIATSPYGLSQVEGEDLSSGTYIGKYDSDGQVIWWKPFTQFEGTQKWILLHKLRFHDGRIYGYGPAKITSGGDTTLVDSIQIVGRQGDGYALVCLDPLTGVAEWFRLDGFPSAASGAQRMALDPLGNIVVAGSYGGAGGTAVIGEDTLAAPTSYSKAFIAKYSSNGTIQYVREYMGSQAFSFRGVDLTPDGHMALTGQFRGEITLGGGTFTAHTNADLHVTRLDPDGEPLGFIHTTSGSGRSIRFLGMDVVVTGQFPAGNGSLWHDHYRQRHLHQPRL